MKPAKILHIALFISLLFLPPASAFAEDCLEAREWFEEGLYLSDNSNREISFYWRAIELCPEFVAAHNRLGQVYKSQGKYALSIKAFEQARIQALASQRFASRSDSRALFLESAVSLGEIYRIQGKYERAAEEFAKALQMEPDSLAAQNNLQYVYKRLHNYDTMLPRNNNLLSNAIFTRIPGLTLPDNGYSLDFQWKHWQQNSDPISADMVNTDDIVFLSDNSNSNITELENDDFRFLITPAELSSTVNIFTGSVRYGLTKDMTVGLIPKFIYRTMNVELAGFNNLDIPKKFELGDTELLFKYHLWGKRKKHLSFYTLLNLPTGEEVRVVGKDPLFTWEAVVEEDGTKTRKSFDFDFVRYVPYGSESYDITPGVALTLGFDPLTFHSNLQYRFTDHKLIGDEFRFNMAALFNMNPNVNATMELNYRWQGEARRKFHAILNKFQPDISMYGGPIAIESYYTAAGGHTLFLSPGLQFTVAQGLRLEFGVQIPVIKPSSGWTENVIYQLGLTIMSF